MSEELRIPLDNETVSALWDPATDPKALLIVAHGSGAGKDHPFMSGFATALPGLGISTLRFNFPYIDAGKKFPDRAPRAVEVWKRVREWAAENLAAGLPVFAAGKSFGGRMASQRWPKGCRLQASSSLVIRCTHQRRPKNCAMSICTVWTPQCCSCREPRTHLQHRSCSRMWSENLAQGQHCNGSKAAIIPSRRHTPGARSSKMEPCSLRLPPTSSTSFCCNYFLGPRVKAMGVLALP